MTTALVVALLVGGGTWLVLRRGLLRVVVGFVLLGHGANLVVLSAGGTDRRGFPLPGQQGQGPLADPVPQAFVLTAIVIAFAVTVHLLGLLRAGRDERGDAAPEGAADPVDADPVDADPVDDARGPA
ncbi:sodium:proton antiporter [Quadrisphaera sp. KR29]|uniref:sodium:proton antiporter n=1 Tax=Quadrisphaera sp. KR29 TaxID=3461391 RepID=UPI004044E4DA